ncbi:uncharacterized protein MKZ38_004068 [Zalerion maritima]|uniref:Uncharacterized protein n=1 Tax=Zalerion maritima TaxID=339359 RepID=A0AAD5RWN9_9PEZI|nr:uncharacterized protein MKZ38_004068 [Zalerion maritima]
MTHSMRLAVKTVFRETYEVWDLVCYQVGNAYTKIRKLKTETLFAREASLGPAQHTEIAIHHHAQIPLKLGNGHQHRPSTAAAGNLVSVHTHDPSEIDNCDLEARPPKLVTLSFLRRGDPAVLACNRATHTACAICCEEPLIIAIGWPSTGGLCVLDDATGAGLDYLGIDRLVSPSRSENQEEDVAHLKRMGQPGASWMPRGEQDESGTL